MWIIHGHAMPSGFEWGDRERKGGPVAPLRVGEGLHGLTRREEGSH